MLPNKNPEVIDKRYPRVIVNDISVSLGLNHAKKEVSNSNLLHSEWNRKLHLSDKAQSNKKIGSPMNTFRLKNLLKNEKYKIQISHLDTIKLALCKKSGCIKNKNKFILFEKAQITMKKFFDISVIIKKLDEYDKLKMILLSYEQSATFQFISKTVCSTEEDEIGLSEINMQKDFSNSKSKAYQIVTDYHRRLKRDANSWTDIDKKLFRLINKDIKNKLNIIN